MQRSTKVFLLLLQLVTGVAFAESTGQRAERILQESGVRGGLIAQVGCDDPDLLVHLRVDNSFCVQGIDTDAKAVAAAREQIQSRDAYGVVSADTWDGRRLPYTDNLVNLLLLADETQPVSDDEIRRVLVPGGVAMRLQASDLDRRLFRKPWPTDVDQWTHWLHGADGNAVADDHVVGPPCHLQWIEKPLWLKHHNSTINLSAMVSANGRVFYILDESPIGRFGTPARWSLLARDAFNGLLLWKRPIDHWGWKAWVTGEKNANSRFDQPMDVQRQLVAVGDAVYVPLSFGAGLSRLNAATGEIEATYADTAPVSEVLRTQDKLIVSVHQPATAADGLLTKGLRVFDATAGTLLWKKDGLAGLMGKTNELKKYTGLCLATDGRRLFYVDHESVAAVDLQTGKQAWSISRPPRGDTKSNYAQLYLPDLCTLVVHQGRLLFGQTEAINRIPWNEPVRATLIALDAATGKTLWQKECGNWGYGSGVDLFAVDDLVWVHAFEDYALLGLDLATGKIMKNFPTGAALDGSHHHRCYRNKATTDYVLTARRGIELIDLDNGENRLNHWVRGACRYGIMPCNGLIYSPPNPCMCYATAKVNGFLALSARRDAVQTIHDSSRLVRGPAFGKVERSTVQAAWPAYRHDARRSGSTSMAVKPTLTRSWSAQLGGRPTSVTAASGRIFVASPQTHTVYCLDGETGAPIWHFTTGGPVDSPPTFHNGLLLLGSADGNVYALRVSDGALAWQFRAAASADKIMAFGQLESPSPVHGSVLVQNDVAYITAGRSSFLDGGIRIHSLDPDTGRLLRSRTLCSADPKTGQGEYDASLRYDMPPDHPGALSDILVSDGHLIHMRQIRIDPKDVARDFEDEMTEAERTAFYRQKETGKVLDFGPQITSTAGLLDDSWFNQTFWSFENASYARLLVFDDRATYGLKAFTGSASRHARSKFTVGTSKYVLFADDRRTKKRRWSVPIPIRAQAMVVAGSTLFVAGAEELPSGPSTSNRPPRGLLWAVSVADGTKLAEYVLHAVPVWDGMAVVDAGLCIATTSGKIECWKQAD